MKAFYVILWGISALAFEIWLLNHYGKNIDTGCILSMYISLTLLPFCFLKNK